MPLSPLLEYNFTTLNRLCDYNNKSSERFFTPFKALQPQGSKLAVAVSSSCQFLYRLMTSFTSLSFFSRLLMNLLALDYFQFVAWDVSSNYVDDDDAHAVIIKLVINFLCLFFWYHTLVWFFSGLMNGNWGDYDAITIVDALLWWCWFFKIFYFFTHLKTFY